MDFKNLNPELGEKALVCETPEELIELAKETGYPLTNEELQTVSGGADWTCTGDVCTDDDIW